MECRLRSAIRTYAFSEDKNVHLIISEIQLIIDEEIDYDPVSFENLFEVVLDSSYLQLDHRILLIEKLLSMGIKSRSVPVILEFVECALFNHDLHSIQKLIDLRISIGWRNFLCLMTSDHHLPFLTSVVDILPVRSSSLREYVNICIKCDSWKTLDFILSMPNLPNFRVVKQRYTISPNQSISLNLIEKSEEKFLKYITRFYSLGLPESEEACATAIRAVEKEYVRSFQMILEKNNNNHSLFNEPIRRIIEGQKQSFLYGWSPNMAIPFIRKIICAKWFIGFRIMLEKSNINDEQCDQRKLNSWLNASYKPKNKESIKIFNYLRMRFPQKHEVWKSIYRTPPSDEESTAS